MTPSHEVRRRSLLPLNFDRITHQGNQQRGHCFIIGSGARELVGFRGPITERILDHGYQVSAASTGETKKELDWYTQRGVAYYRLPLDRTGIDPLSELRCYRFLNKLFRETKPNCVLLYTHKPMIYGSLAARKNGIENINALLAGLGYGFGNQQTIKGRIANLSLHLWHRIAKNNIKNLFFVNPHDLQDFVDAGLIGKKTNVELLPGEGKDVLHYAYQPPPVGGPIRFNLITRLLVQKGVADFAEASRLVKKIHPEVQFDLIGPYDSNPDRISQQLVDQWTAENLVTYHGQVEDVRGFYENCYATILPTVYREGLPNVLLEAMAMGRPVITYRNPGCTQTIENPTQLEPGLSMGTNGFLIEPKRVDLIAKAVQFLIENPDQVLMMGKAGRRIAEEKFDVGMINDRILAKIGIG